MKEKKEKEEKEEKEELADAVLLLNEAIRILNNLSKESKPKQKILLNEVQERKESHSINIFPEILKLLNGVNFNVHKSDANDWYMYSFVRVTDLTNDFITYSRLVSKSSEQKTGKIPVYLQGFFEKNKAYLIKYPVSKNIKNCPIEWALTDNETILIRAARTFVNIFHELKQINQ